MVANVAEFPHVVVVPPDLPVKTLADFVAYAKAHRGSMNFGGSLGTPPQLLGSLFSKVADLRHDLRALQGRRAFARRPDERPAADAVRRAHACFSR